MTTPKRATQAAESPRAESQSDPTIEVVARFQLQTETLLSEHRQQVSREMVKLERHQARLEDETTRLREGHAELLRGIGDAQREIRAGITEVNVALRSAVEQARKAAESAAVYEKLKDAQPDFFGMVKATKQKCGELEDRLYRAESSLNTLRGQLDKDAALLVSVKAATDSNSRLLSNPRISGGLVEVT
jgi:predicted  nucleic acid-binding Zn-ribbon protein